MPCQPCRIRPLQEKDVQLWPRTWASLAFTSSSMAFRRAFIASSSCGGMHLVCRAVVTANPACPRASSPEGGYCNMFCTARLTACSLLRSSALGAASPPSCCWSSCASRSCCSSPAASAYSSVMLPVGLCALNVAKLL
jgi:hypothetical protein